MINSSRSFKTEGIVIKRRNFGEADRILTVFSKRNGKIQVKANGVRKITSRRSSHIELLNYSLFNLYSGRNLPILTEVETFENFSFIKEDLTKVGFAYHICELVDGLCAENQENRKVLELLLNVFSKLSKEENIADIIHEFEVDLLVNLGFFRHVNSLQHFNSSSFIEELLERKLKAKQVITHFIE